MDEDDALAQRIKAGTYKNRNISIPTVTLAHDISRLRTVLDGVIADLQRARAHLDVLNMPYHLRFSEMDFELSRAQSRGTTAVAEVAKTRRSHPMNPVVPFRR